MAASKLLPLYAQIAGCIAEQIEASDFEPGQRIYSIREICKSFNVGDVTAKKAIQQLRQRGLIHTINGSGAYVTDRSADGPAATVPDKRTVGFIKIGMHPAPVFAYGIDLLQQELGKLGHAMIYAVVQSEQQLASAMQQVKQSHPGCVLLFPPHRADFDLPGCLAQLREINVPSLLVESRQPKSDYITTDTERATLELCNYLYELGHRRICLATQFGRKVTGFQNAMRYWNDPSVKHWIIGEPGKTDSDSRQLADHVLSLQPRPTAVIAADDHAAAVMVSHFLQCGVSVPEQISVVTYGDHPQSADLSPVPMTVMRHPFLEIAQEAARWAHQQIAPRGRVRTVRREITGTLIIRDSSGPPPA
jgi:DNA-binding LacI/PurR family transcriptional regulator